MQDMDEYRKLHFKTANIVCVYNKKRSEKSPIIWSYIRKLVDTDGLQGLVVI